MSNTPLVSVVMPVYNAEKYLKTAIESILQQTYSNFEFIIIDDASDDDSYSIIKSYLDPRIKVHKQRKNQGVAATANNGITEAKGKYIARMDADDISLPVRLARQVKFLESNPMIGLCGSYVKTIGSGLTRVLKFPTNDEQIKCLMLLRCAMAHPTTMLRSEVLKKNNIWYSKNFANEDYHFYSQLYDKTQMANIPEVLLYYRKHSSQLTTVNKLSILRDSAAISRALYEKSIFDLSNEELDTLSSLPLHPYQDTNANIQKLLPVLDKIREQSQQKQIFSEEAVRMLVGEYCYFAVKGSEPRSINSLRSYFGYKFASGFKSSVLKELYLIYLLFKPYKHSGTSLCQ